MDAVVAGGVRYSAVAVAKRLKTQAQAQEQAVGELARRRCAAGMLE